QAESERKRATLAGEIEEEFKLSKDYIRHLISELQKQPSIAKAQKTQADLDKLRKELGWTDAKTTSPSGSATNIVSGQRVRVRSLGQNAIVENVTGEANPADRQATVRAGSLRIKVHLSDLEALEGAAPPRSQPVSTGKSARSRLHVEASHTSSGAPAPFIRTARNTIDLRGRRVDDALLEVEKFLDDAALSGVGSVMIIHGHGTGAVRNAVRGYLEQSQYAAAFRPGENHEGGNGVTIVSL
ncbi:MAG TPA: Smr/MutS family protein, partial [Chroococcales cyanobacterium]